MNYIESPTEWDGAGPSLFLAGGITGCPDWQQELVWLLGDTTLTVLNPRRADFPIDNPLAAPEQILWEYKHLRRASMISFWFPADTLCPIVLYELGAWSMTSKPIFIGMDPNYQRWMDVQIQTRLVRPDVEPVSTLEELADQIRAALAVPA